MLFADCKQILINYKKDITKYKFYMVLCNLKIMAKMTKIFDETYQKGAVQDDSIYRCMNILNHFTHKPTNEESDLVNGDVGDLSYSTIVDKKFRIVVYVEG